MENDLFCKNKFVHLKPKYTPDQNLYIFRINILLKNEIIKILLLKLTKIFFTKINIF